MFENDLSQLVRTKYHIYDKLIVLTCLEPVVVYNFSEIAVFRLGDQLLIAPRHGFHLFD